MDINYNQLDELGYFEIKNFLSKDQIRKFESNISLICKSQANLMGETLNDQDPFIDLFKKGGEYRKNLYTLVQHLEILLEIEKNALELVKKDNFRAWKNFLVPIAHCGIRVDIPGEHHFMNPVHQDIYSCNCNTALRIWVPLRDTNKKNGTMKIYPKSHKLGFVEPEFTKSPHYPLINEEKYKEFDEKILEVKAGNAIIFNPLLLHGSVPGSNTKIKFVAGCDLQDLSTIANPDDQSNSLAARYRISKQRKINRNNLEAY